MNTEAEKNIQSWSNDNDFSFDFDQSEISEFGSDFYYGNPGIIQAQRNMRHQHSEIHLQLYINRQSLQINEPQPLNVNLAHDFRVKGYGLNQNKRGKMKQKDYDHFLQSIQEESQTAEYNRNQSFKQIDLQSFQMRQMYFKEFEQGLQVRQEQIKEKMAIIQSQINDQIQRKIDHDKKLEDQIDNVGQIQISSVEEEEEKCSDQIPKSIPMKLDENPCPQIKQQKNSHYVSEKIIVGGSVVNEEEENLDNNRPSRKAQSQDFDPILDIPQIQDQRDFRGAGILQHMLANNSKDSWNSCGQKNLSSAYSDAENQVNYQQALLVMIRALVKHEIQQSSLQNYQITEIPSQFINLVQILKNHGVDFDVGKIIRLNEHEIQQVMQLIQLLEITLEQSNQEEEKVQASPSLRGGSLFQQQRQVISNPDQGSFILHPENSLYSRDSSQRDCVSIKDLSQNSKCLSGENYRKEALENFRKRYSQGKFRLNSNNSQGSANNKWGNNSSLQSRKSSSESSYRRQKLEGLNLDYQDYFKKFQSIFIVRCQLMSVQYHQFKQINDIQRLMTGFKNFEKMQNLFVSSYPKNFKTLVIDIENTLITRYEIKSQDELDQLKQSENFEQNFIIVDINQFQKNIDNICVRKNCVCHLQVYIVRPYTYEMLRAIQPFFELIIFTNMPKKIVGEIVQKIEDILNEPVKEQVEIIQKNQQNFGQLQRITQIPQIKIYFNYIINEKQYLHIKDLNVSIENLLLLTKNRQKDNLIFLSSNPFRIIAGISQGFLFIPIIPFEYFYKNDYQLNIVENYLLQQRHLKEFASKIRKDFMFLATITQKQIVQQDLCANSNEEPRLFENNSFNKPSSPLIEIPERIRPQRVGSNQDFQNEEVKLQEEVKNIYKTDQMGIQARQIQYDAKQVILEEGTDASQSNDCSNGILSRDMRQSSNLIQSNSV